MTGIRPLFPRRYTSPLRPLREEEDDPILAMRRMRERVELPDDEESDPIAAMRNMRVQADATARPGYTQPQRRDVLPERTIGPVRTGVRNIPVPTLKAEDLETGGSLGTQGYTFGDAARDLVKGRGAFAPNKPAGLLADINPVTGAARAGAATRELVEKGHPALAAGVAATAALPFFGRPARGAMRKAAGSVDDLLPAGREPLGTAYAAPIDAGSDPRLANIKKLNLSPESEQKVRDAYQRLGLDKRTVTFDEMRESAAELGINPGALLGKAGRLRGDEVLAIRDVISQNARRMVELGQQRTKALTDEARRVIDVDIAFLSEETDQFLKRYSTERTRAGRDLSALRILARDSMDPGVWLAQAQRVKRELPLSSDEALQISALATKNDRDGLIRYVSSLHETSTLDKTLAIWKAGLLTSLQTTGVNMAGNLAMGVAETVKDVPATMIDAVISAVRGTERTKALSFRGSVTNQLAALGPGSKAALRVLKHGQSAEELAKWDFRQINFGDNAAGRIAHVYTQAVFRSLSAQDALFRGAAMGRALEEHARVHARKLVKAGAAMDMDHAMDQLRKNPPAELVTNAMLDAEVAVFQQDNALARGFNRLKHEQGPGVRAALEFSAPFVKTPTNIGGTLIQYSPVGFVTALTKQLRNPSQKKLAEDLGRAITGSGLVALGWMLAEEGLATGAAPKSASERAQWELEGKQANSVRIGDRYYNVSRLAPIGGLIAVGAQMREAFRSAESFGGGVAGAALTPVRVALDQSFAKGVSGALEAVNDPTRAGDIFIENTAGSLVPAGAAMIARGTDPHVRAPEGVGERIRSRIPIASRGVPPRLDAFGKPVPQRGGLARQAFDIFQSRRATDDPLIHELARVGVNVGFPSRTETIDIGREKVQRRRTPDEYRAFMQQVGPETEQVLRRVVASEEYQNADDDFERATVLERVIGRVRTGVRRREAFARQQELDADPIAAMRRLRVAGGR